MSDIRRATMKGEFVMLAHTPGPAKQLEGAMRAAGHMVRVLATPGLDSFRDVLAKSEIEIVIFHHEFKDCELLQAVEAAQRIDPDVPVLLLNDRVDAAVASSATGKGANGAVCLNDLQLLETTCLREYRHHQLRREVRELRTRLEALERERTEAADQSQRPILTVQEGIVVTANAALAVALHADDPDELIGMPFMDLVTPPYQAAMKDTIKRYLKGKGDEEPQALALQFPDHEPFALVASLTLVDVEGEPAIEIAGTTRGRARAADAISMGQRRSDIIDAVAEVRALAGDGVAILVMFRIDNNPHLDATYGYIGGDEIRHQFVDAVRNMMIRQANLIPFCDGTLVWVGRSTSIEQAREDVTKIQRHVARSVFSYNDRDATVTGSAVMHPLDDATDDVEAILTECANALDALCAAGTSGLEICGRSAAPSVPPDQTLAESWRNRVADALKHDRLQLSFQSIASLGGDNRQLSDVLVRIIDDKDRSHAGREFMGFIEDTPQVVALDRQVVALAVQTIEQLVADGKTPVLFVRISGLTLRSTEKFAPWLAQLLDAHPIPEHSLVLMLRESDVQQHLKRALVLLSKAKAAGIDTAIDHFGILPTSADLIRRVKADFVKLHSDFTTEITRPNAEMKSLNAIMDVASDRGILTIAEQVSDANAMARLWQLGVNYLMGAHVHAPETEVRAVQFELH